MPPNQQPVFDPGFFTQAGSIFQQAAQNALPSQASQDNAAARVRARLEARNRDSARQIRDQFGGFRANTGAFQNALAQNRAAGQGAIAQGLSDLEADFAQRRQQGAQILQGIGSGLTGLGTGANEARQSGQEIANRFNLGQGEIDLRKLLGERELDNSRQANFIDFLNTIGQVGNTTGRVGGDIQSVIQQIIAQFQGG